MSYSDYSVDKLWTSPLAASIARHLFSRKRTGTCLEESISCDVQDAPGFLEVVKKASELDRAKEALRSLAELYFRRVLMSYGSDYQHDEIVNMMNTDAADAVRAAQAAHREAMTNAVQP